MSVQKLIIELLGVDKASPALRRVAGESDKMAKSFASLGGVLELAGVAGFAYLGKQALDAAWDLGELGAQSLRSERALDELAKQAGGSADEIVAAIRAATMGTVSDMEIMAAANRGILLGLGADAKQWAQLTEVAAYRARAMGLSTSQALSDITTGIGRESRLVLDNLGIILDLDRVMADYAATIGKTTEQLSAAERKQAILNSVIKEGQAQIAAAGGINDDYAASFERVGVAIDELKVAMAREFAPEVAHLADILTYVISATGSDLEVPLANAAQAAKTAGGGFREMAEAAAEAKTKMTWGTDAAFFGIPMKATKLTADQLIQIGEQAGATGLEIIELANELGVELPSAFIAAAVAAARYNKQSGDIISTSDKERAALDKITVGLYNQAAAYELVYENIERKARARITGEAIWSFGDPYELESGMTGALEAIRQQEEDNASRAVELAEQHATAWNKAYDTQEDRLRDLRSTIEAALSPTAVTALDMGLTDIGLYEDKWDENARRLEAIAARGFGELEAHPDWAGLLKIPPEVLQSGEEAVKSWAQQTADAVRNLVRPDLLNVDAAVAAVEQHMQDQAAKELSIDIIAQAMIAKGTLNPEDAKKQVAQALGLDQTFVGENVGEQMLDGLKASMEASNPAAQFAGYVQRNTQANTALLRTTGENLWHVVNIGIDVAMKHTEYVKKLASLIAPEVAQILQERGVWGGTTP